MLTLFSLVFSIWGFFSTWEATYAMSFIPISFPTLKRRRPEKNKYVIYRTRSVRMRKNCALGLEYDPRPSASGRTRDPKHSFFPIRTSRPVNNIYFVVFSLFRFCVILDHSNSKQTLNNIQKTSPQSHKTELKILENPGLA